MLREERKVGVEIEYTGEGTRDTWPKHLEALCNKYGTRIYTDYSNRKAVEAQHDFHLTYDGSVNGIGLELLTRPFSLKDKIFIDKFRNIMESIRNLGGEVDLSCGLHIHISGKDLLAKDMKNLIMFYWLWERVLYSLLHKHRSKSGYCKPLPENTPDKLSKIKKCSDFKKIYHLNRHGPINICPWVHQRHYEVRMGHGMLNPQRILNWVALHLHIAQYAKGLEEDLLETSTVSPDGQYAKYSATEGNIEKMLEIIDFEKAINYFINEYRKWRET